MAISGQGPTGVSERSARLDDARNQWRKKLIDRSRRNNLLYFRDLKVGTLDLTECDSRQLDDLIAGRAVPLSRLYDTDDLTQAQAKSLTIRRKSLANLEEKGLETLFLGVGMATWASPDSGRDADAPVLLVPIAIEMRAADGSGTSLKRIGDIQANEILLDELREEFGVTIEPAALLGGEAEGEEGESVDVQSVYGRLKHKAHNVRGFDIRHRVVLGNFAFQKLAMVRDLEELADRLADHDLVAAIAGDPLARQAVLELRQEVDPAELDSLPPSEEPFVRDSDSSQRRAIQAVIKGQHGVIQGPPGTGKSQTIANLIGAMAARGRRVLFVAEKRAALEAVLTRLEEAGLRHLALDLHGASVRRRQVLDQIRESLEQVRGATDPNLAQLDSRLAQLRQDLNEHVLELHRVRDPFGLSAYQVLGELLQVPPAAHSRVRFTRGQLDQLGEESVQSIHDAVAQLSALAQVYCATGRSPWVGSSIADTAAAADALRLARDVEPLHTTFEPDAIEVTNDAGWGPPQSVREVGGTIALLLRTNATLQSYESEIFGDELPEHAVTLGRGEGGFLRLVRAWLTSRSFRFARRRYRRLRREKARFPQLLSEIRSAAEQLEGWVARGVPQPKKVQAAYAAQASFEKLDEQLRLLEGVLQRSLGELGFLELTDLLQALSQDSRTPYQVADVARLTHDIRAGGAEAILEELRERPDLADAWPQIFRHAWLSSVWERVLEETPRLAAFEGSQHEQLLQEFKNLDRKHIVTAAARVRRAHAEHAIHARNTYTEQDAVVRREAQKRSRHMPVRKLFAEASDVLTSLRPCWMASPLSVSQLLPAVESFDLVVFDEASQVLPQDAIPSLVRGRFTVVAGDEHQLPPTTFFFYTGEEEGFEEETHAAIEGFESLLNVMASLLEPWRLQWHYRSRSEELIAFSNRFIYEKKDGQALITFPAAWSEGVVSHVLVNQDRSSDGEEESSSAEVLKVVDLVLGHAEAMMEKPEDEWETLGVIAMGIKHANRIQASLDRALADRPELASFFTEDRPERMFIKNLERVQGDERDVIVLSIGYARNRSGTLRHHFGPINNEGGERRLNVAITRARDRMVVISSFAASDLDPRKLRAEGAQLLKAYLEYAASGGELLEAKGPTGEPMNPFEVDIFNALKTQGIDLIPQFGASPYKLDFAVQHPRQPGRSILAIECDGASYHSAQSARDRDRLRQQELEARGWRFHRIWSTDWFYRREDEIARALTAIEKAVQSADRRDQSTSQPASMRLEGPATDTEHADRGRPPRVATGLKIQDYTPAQLDSVMRWIMSDGLLRTVEEMIEEAVTYLGFQRRGKNIIGALRRAAERWHRRHGKGGA